MEKRRGNGFLLSILYFQFSIKSFAFSYLCAMHIESLTLVNFRNHADRKLLFEPGVNCIIGSNGIGKTNVLDAVYYLSMCRSYLNPTDRQNIAFNEQFFVIQGNWMKNESEYVIHCGVKLGHKKSFKKNKKEYSRMADHIGQFPVVMISPYDVDLIKEGSEVRRRWIDGIISQFDAAYLSTLQRYNKVLDQRNALLKLQFENGFFQREPLEIWDEQLVKYANEIHLKRKEFISEFTPLFQQFYSVLSNKKEVVALDYESQMNEGKLDELLVQAYPRDSRSTHTSVGAHKDDLLFQLDEQPVKKFGSQGQQKCYLIALKLAQFAWLKDHLQQTPVLLLDDIFDKLDNERVAQLMRMVSDQLFSQVLVTDTDEDRVKRIFSSINVTPNLINFE